MTTTAEPTLAPALQLPAALPAPRDPQRNAGHVRLSRLRRRRPAATKRSRSSATSCPSRSNSYGSRPSSPRSPRSSTRASSRSREFGLLHDRFPYFTMEYFAGKKISEYFDGHSWPALYDVILQIASGAAPHPSPRHHPSRSEAVEHPRRRPRPARRSWTSAWPSRAGRCSTGRSAASLHYMPPEVLKQDRVDSRADLYSLGMTLYETVTGALPGYGKPSIEVIRMHLDEEIRPPSSINPRVPPELEQIIMKLLEKDPRHRYRLGRGTAAGRGRGGGEDSADAGELLVGRGELFAAPLIGRKTEVAQLASMIDEARDGRGNGVIVAGAEGMGKSRIVRDATLRAQLEGARVFCGRCPINRKTIYAPFFEIFQQMVMAVNPDADVSAEIRRLLRPRRRRRDRARTRAGAPARSTASTTASCNRCRTCTASSAPVAEGESSASPLILVIEDVQWADPSTAELFSFLDRRGEAEPAARHRHADDRSVERSRHGAGRASGGVGAARARRKLPDHPRRRAQRAARARASAVAPRRGERLRRVSCAGRCGSRPARR